MIKKNPIESFSGQQFQQPVPQLQFAVGSPQSRPGHSQVHQPSLGEEHQLAFDQPQGGGNVPPAPDQVLQLVQQRRGGHGWCYAG